MIIIIPKHTHHRTIIPDHIESTQIHANTFFQQWRFYFIFETIDKHSRIESYISEFRKKCGTKLN